MKTRLLILTICIEFVCCFVTNAQSNLSCDELIKEIDTLQNNIPSFKNGMLEIPTVALPPIIAKLWKHNESESLNVNTKLQDAHGSYVALTNLRSALILMKFHVTEICRLNEMDGKIARQFEDVLKQLKEQQSNISAISEQVSKILKLLQDVHFGTKDDKEGNSTIWGMLKLRPESSTINTMLDTHNINLKEYIHGSEERIIKEINKGEPESYIPDVSVLAGYYAEHTISVTGIYSMTTHAINCVQAALLVPIHTADRRNLFGFTAGGGIIQNGLAFIPGIAYQTNGITEKDKWSWHGMVCFMKKDFTVGLGFSPLFGFGAHAGWGF